MAAFSSSSSTCLNDTKQRKNDKRSKEDKRSGESDSKSLRILPPGEKYSSFASVDGPQQSTKPIDIPSPSSARTSLSSFSSFRDSGGMNSLRRSPHLFPCEDHFSPGDSSPPPIRRLSQLSEKMQMFYWADDKDKDNDDGVLLIGGHADRVADQTVSTSYKDVMCAECHGDIGCHKHHMHLQSAYQDQNLQCHECQEVFSVKRYLQDREQFHGTSAPDDIFPLF